MQFSYLNTLNSNKMKELLEYYKTVDQEGAADYWRYYEEMLAEE